MNNPYEVIKSRRLTEKSRVLENLQHATSNPSVSRCKSPKAVFNVAMMATKTQIKQAVELIYADKKVKVVSVNTVSTKPKLRRVRGFLGKTSHSKKAIVTFRPGDVIDEQV
jgi:large subunit ribosomal protein L23